VSARKQEFGPRPAGKPAAAVPARFAWITQAQFVAFAQEGTDAHRLCSGAGGWTERLGNDALVCFRSHTSRSAMLAGLDAFAWKPRRVFGKLLSRDHTDRTSPELLRGDASAPLDTVVSEAGVLYGLDFSAGYSTGLFLDQRANRALVRRSPPKRLLNTFAYTCSFSVAAALGGAGTVSVDLSKKSLDRGRANFVRNGLDASSGHRFLADDVLEVIPRLARRGEKFDAVILDPPTFSRGNKGRVWKVEEHFAALLTAALPVVAPGGRVLLSTNSTACDGPMLEAMARECLGAAGLRGVFHREPALPDFPPGHGAVTTWLTLR
jgi:23S rRNA (cytosine1962-C5)-methyltransferase